MAVRNPGGRFPKLPPGPAPKPKPKPVDPGTHGGGTTPGTTTTSEQTAEISQSPSYGAMTTASTTAPPPSDAAADQSDLDLDAFFGSGTGSAPQYDDSVSNAEPQRTGGSSGT